ncbi:TadE family type IV pilus minor pilin [Glycomyces xiaoerkulensis]|uniref:TadE family type IV pilus minor pilin n=1 Tax=Glycomyces xiaoerkulensis TaxID=2038139 RepID=UPI0018E4A189|nr:TadE family type IV pilus minor pilin [Glycomyces xiaoerkulensis]
MRPRDRGFVTAELAAAMPAVVAVLAMAVWAVGTMGLKVRSVDAANSAALAAARGEDARAVAAAYLPDGATVSVSTEGDLVRAEVTVASRPLGPLAPPVTVESDATAAVEPGVLE